MRTIYAIAVLLVASLPAPLASYAQSSIYSPALNGRIAATRSFELGAAVGLFPETRPDVIDRALTPGIEVALRAWIDARARFAMRVFMETSGEAYHGGERSGIGLDVTYVLDDPGAPGERMEDAARTLKSLVIRAQTVYSDGTNEGAGIGLSFVIQPPAIGRIVPFVGVGPFVAIRKFDAPPPATRFFITEEQTRTQWGYGAIANVGGALRLDPSVDLLVEVAGGIQYNHWEAITTPFIAPSLGVSWHP